MGLGGLGGNTVAFGIKAVADLRGVDQTARALSGLNAKGAAAGTGITRGMGTAAASLANVQNRADLAAHSLRGIAAASAGILGVGVALFKVGEGFDRALDTIRIGTGATGKALAGLGNDARAVFREVPASLQTVAEAITELNRRTGDTGKGLQELTAAEIELAHITHTDLNENIVQTSKLFQQWGIDVENQVGTLDKLFRASQSTGISVGTLAGELVQFGPILRTMGFGLDQSIALLATLDKAGVNTQQVIVGLRTAIAKFSAAGVTDLGAALAGVFAQIKNAPSDVAAATIAIDHFGARAGPALAENIRSGRISYQDLIGVVSNGNETIHKAVQATQDFSEKMHILRNRAKDALIPLGIQMFNALNALIPALTKVAQASEFIGNAFSKLPGPVKQAVGAAIVLVGAIAGISFVASTLASVVTAAAGGVVGLATAMGLVGVSSAEAAAGIAEVGVAAAASAAGVTALAVAEDEVAVSSAAAVVGTRTLAASLGSLAALSAAGIVIGVAVVLTGDFIDALRHGGTSFVDQIAAEVGRAIAIAFEHIPGLGKAADSLNANIDEALASLSVQDRAIKLGFTIDTKGFANAGDAVIKEIGITIREAQQEADAAGLTIDQYLANYKDVLGVTKDVTAVQQEQTVATTDQTDALAAQVDEQIASKKAQDDLSRAVKDTLNQQFLASAASQGLLLPFTRGAEDAQKATEDFNKTLDGITAGAINAAKGISDISSELPGVQAGFGKAGDSVTDLVRKMDDIGVINLSPAVRQALDFASALTKVEANIAGVEAAITNNQQDLAMWQARISLVTDTFGANSQQINDWIAQLENGTITQEQFNAAIAGLSSSGGFPKLDALLASGKISQKEYAAAVEAGTHLLQRSAGALGDEEAEIVRNIIALDKYVKQHDDADGAVKNLTESQRGFVAAMADSKTQTFLQTLQLLAYLASIGQIPPESVTKFIADSSAADPVIASVAQDLGLIAGTHTGTVKMDTAPALASLKDVKGVVAHISDDGATITVKARTEEAAQKFLELNKGAIADLDGRELIVKVKGDDGEYKIVRDAVIGDKIPDKVVNVTANLDSFLAGGDGSSPDLGHIASAVQSPTVIQPPPVVFTAVDEVTPVLTGVNNELVVFATDATILGQTAGQGFVNAAAAGISDGISNIGAAANNVLGALNSVGVATTNLGFNDGYSFGVGLANGINATAQAVFNAAFNVGYAAHLGTQAGMQAHSPSRLARQDGENWVNSFVASLDAGKGAVRRSASDLSKLMQTSLSSPATSPALRGLLTVDQRPARILSDSINAQRGGNATSNAVHFQVTNHFNGITDTGEIINEVNTSVFRAFDRGGAAGLFGR